MLSSPSRVQFPATDKKTVMAATEKSVHKCNVVKRFAARRQPPLEKQDSGVVLLSYLYHLYLCQARLISGTRTWLRQGRDSSCCAGAASCRSEPRGQRRDLLRSALPHAVEV